MEVPKEFGETDRSRKLFKEFERRMIAHKSRQLTRLLVDTPAYRVYRKPNGRGIEQIAFFCDPWAPLPEKPPDASDPTAHLLLSDYKGPSLRIDELIIRMDATLIYRSLVNQMGAYFTGLQVKQTLEELERVLTPLTIPLRSEARDAKDGAGQGGDGIGGDGKSGDDKSGDGKAEKEAGGDVNKKADDNAKDGGNAEPEKKKKYKKRKPRVK
ncbi:hypothetical protein F4861DRAFT_537824 [Xylaria intraflava]|nr:hypothetical protein F4861DRAFT_537824 [Xylaria intraflava]